MSQKVAAFRSYISNPLNIHNFFVDIPGIGEYGLVVQATTFPGERARVTTLFVAGERVSYPTVPDNDHSWAVTVPESDSGETYKRFGALIRKYWDQETGALTINSENPFDRVIVYARDLNGNVVISRTLVNAWLQGPANVNLNAQNPEENFKWEFTFVFDYILDSD